MQEFGDAFLGMDSDGDGRVSREDLSEALEKAARLWSPKIDAHRLFGAMDRDGSGTLGFTDFIAACLHANFCSIEELLQASFLALNEGRHRTLSTQDIQRLLLGCKSPILRHLPQNYWLGTDDWVSFLAASCQLTNSACQSRPMNKSSWFFEKLFCGGGPQFVAEDPAEVCRQTVLSAAAIVCF